MHRLSILATAVALAGCTVSGPVAVVASDGELLRGTATSILVANELSGGEKFAVRGRARECRGQSDPALGSPAVSIIIGCSDGRSGIGRAFRENAVSGSGKIQMNDGSEASV